MDTHKTKTQQYLSTLLIGFLLLFIASCFLTKDSDKDGIKNKKDRCTDTPSNVKVDEFGCPLDVDGDGVADYRDKCNDTPKSLSVNEFGCPTYTISGQVLDEENGSPLERIALKIRERSTGQSSIIYSDSSGNFRYTVNGEYGINDLLQIEIEANADYFISRPEYVNILIGAKDEIKLEAPIYLEKERKMGSPGGSSGENKLLSKADWHFEHREYDEALRLYEELLSAYPNDEYIRRRIALIKQIDQEIKIGTGNSKSIDNNKTANRNPSPNPSRQISSKVVINIADKAKVKVNASYFLLIYFKKEIDSLTFRNEFVKELNAQSEENETDPYRIRTLTIDSCNCYRISFKFNNKFISIDTAGDYRRNICFNDNDKIQESWMITGLKETSKTPVEVRIDLVLPDGKLRTFSRRQIDMSVEVVKQGKLTEPTFWDRNKMYIYVGLISLLLGGLIYWFWKRIITRSSRTVYFSYAWGEERETIVDELYTSLVNDGFKVVRDKVDLKYRGSISSFMSQIGKAKMIVVAISDKYLKSPFCVFELFEIYRNSKMDKDEFIKKIFPIRVEEINLSDPEVIKYYIDYWQDKEDRMAETIEEAGENITPELALQFQNVKRKVTEIGSILSYLSDMNALDIHTMRENDFEDVKRALSEAIKGID